ncbi:MAG: PQQ-binding-like beta-propeller repeat protein [Phycisphaeraceae bacterium]|nr:PQQ-binding-like beta-propeller repeat protein [Phycisphaeraceae bacterium]
MSSVGARLTEAQARQVDRLVARLGDADFQVRENAALALQRMGDAAVMRLMSGLESDDVEIRARVHEILRNLGHADGVDHIRWLVTFADGLSGPALAAADGQAVIVSGPGFGLASLDAANGQVIWQHGLMAAPHTSAQVVDPYVLIVTKDAQGAALVAVRIEDGRQAWRTQLPPESPGPFAVDEEGRVLMLVAGGKMLLHVDAATGEVVWQSELEFAAMGEPAVDEDWVAVVSRQGRVAALDRRTGQSLWSVDLETEEPVVAWPTAGAGRLIVTTTATVFGLDAEDGQIVWTARRPQDHMFMARPRIHGRQVLISAGNRLLAHRVDNGRRELDAQFRRIGELNAVVRPYSPGFQPQGRWDQTYTISSSRFHGGSIRGLGNFFPGTFATTPAVGEDEGKRYLGYHRTLLTLDRNGTPQGFMTFRDPIWHPPVVRGDMLLVNMSIMPPPEVLLHIPDGEAPAVSRSRPPATTLVALQLP